MKWCKRASVEQLFCEGPDDPTNGPHVNASPEQKLEAKHEARERAYAWARSLGPIGTLIADQAILEIDACEDAVITIDETGAWTASTHYTPLPNKDTWKVEGVDRPIFYTDDRIWPPNTTAIVNSDVGDRINHKLSKL